MKMKQIEIVCRFCGTKTMKEYFPAKSKQRYCDKKCRAMYHTQVWLEKRQKELASVK